MRILAVDPGPVKSAYVILVEGLKPQEFGIVPNEELICIIESVVSDSFTYGKSDPFQIAIEMIASYGMAVGKEVFETCLWIGRFTQAAEPMPVQYIYRKDEKINLCGSMKAKDGNIRQALIDRFGPVGTKKNQGWFYGVSKDIWAAIACGTTYHDMYLKGDI